ncbi:MAG TPA: hypothetical protein VE988_27150 [Gemmataceae bacterium]|nr:hypothetical protein [Gemmataceae bacterium]
MSSSRIPEAVKQIFTATFTARDVAEPLASFDSSTAAAEVKELMDANDFDIVGVRKDGQVAGFLERAALQDGACGLHLRPLADAKVLNDTAPLLDVIMALSRSPFLLVKVLGRVGGIITLADLQKPPVRMWLFGIVTMVEMRFADLIDRHCPGETWIQHLSEGRLQKARLLLEERRRRNQKLELLDCLQFADKVTIIAKNEDVRKQTVFATRRQAEDTAKRLEQLRNNLAHSQDILAMDWDTIVEICEFISQQ